MSTDAEVNRVGFHAASPRKKKMKLPVLSYILSTALLLAACGGGDRPMREAEIPPLPNATPTLEGKMPVRVSRSVEPQPSEREPQRPPAGSDPLQGRFTMADATAGLEGTGPLVATIKTSEGALQCKLFDDKAPVTVANFVGLARGVRPFKSEVDGEWVKKPAYDGTTFHRIIKGFMIQGGDRRGNGTGEPGYVIRDEIWPGAKHDRPGLLCMANRGPNTNGAQFFITDAKVAALDGNYTIFGECSPVSLVHTLASVPTLNGDRPATNVTIESITIGRGPTTARGDSTP
jgi:peptidyl-prolyl cis-trans isomerase A (cyclophilin A)